MNGLNCHKQDDDAGISPTHRVATVCEEKIQGLSPNFSRPIPATFYLVKEYLMKVTLESI